jgi:hypothetical protein
MSQSDENGHANDPGGRLSGPADPSAGTGEAGPPSLFVQIAAAVVIALLAVVAAQSFFTARDLGVVSQNVVNLAARLQAETERSKKLYDEVVVLRGQVGEFKNILQITGRRGADGAAGDAPPGPRDWTGVYVSELAPLLPVLAQYEGDMGEAWIYSDNENFLNSIAKALEALQAGGMEVDVEQPSDQPAQ